MDKKIVNKTIKVNNFFTNITVFLQKIVCRFTENTFIIIIINLFIVDDKNTIKNIFISTNVALNTWLIQVSF